jgi:hypothetical protein
MEKEQSLERLRNLAPKSTENLDKLALAKSLLRYEVWAEARRSEINIALARQTAALMEARKDAEYVFGRSMVLRRIAQEQKNGS